MDTKKVLSLNLTTRILFGFIFDKNSLSALVSAGLINVYLDDYGTKNKYKNCLFFLFNVNNKYYNDLEKQIIGFKSFLDWYDINENTRMLVYKVGNYKQDLEKFKSGEINGFSPMAEAVMPVTTINAELNYEKEIYRYNLESVDSFGKEEN